VTNGYVDILLVENSAYFNYHLIMTYSKAFFYFCLSFIIGIFISSVSPIPTLYSLGILFLGTGIFFIFFGYKRATIFTICLLFAFLGILHYQTANFNIRNNELRQYNEQKVIIVGKILTEPDVRENYVQLTVNSEKIVVGEKIVPISGKFLITTSKYPAYNYADTLMFEGLLKTPEQFEDFNYKDYLAKKGISSLMDRPSIEVIVQRNYSSWWQMGYAQILRLKNNIRKNINQYFSFPGNTLLAAALLGDQSAMPQALKEKLNITGLRHITAISGMNISILCGILMSLLLGIGFWRGQAFWISLLSIFIFVVMIGFQASIIRAGIMGAIFLLGQKVGRMSVSSRAIVITAAIMLALNPLLLMGDVGFQLSFLAMLGIIYLTPLFEELFKFIPKDKFLGLRGIIATTLAAQVFTLPILIYNFGRISWISLFTNILILPIIYWVMIFGFLFAICSVIYSGLGWVFFLPCWFLISYSMKVINIFSQPWAAKTVENIHWIWLVIFYILLGFFLVWLWRRKRLKFLEF